MVLYSFILNWFTTFVFENFRVTVDQSIKRMAISVGDPDPQDPHVFGPPGSGSISQRYGSGSFPCPINVLS